MASKLKNLDVTKVDFVDQGANPDAHIRLFKRRGAPEGGNREGTGPQGEAGKEGFWKRFIHSFASAAGMKDAEISHIMDSVEKGNSFADELNVQRNGKITDELWDLCMALYSALCSVLNDREMDASQAEESMQESIRQFAGVMAGSVPEWCAGRAAGIIKKNAGDIPAEELEIMKSARDRLSGEIAKASGEPEENRKGKGEPEEMRINKSKLTPAERAFLEDIEKRCGEDDTGEESGSSGEIDSGTGAFSGEEAGAGTPAVEKSFHQESTASDGQGAEAQAAQTQAPENGNDIYKGLHPAVAAELEALKKFRADAEDRELNEIAKKYAVIGRKEEELVPLFKNLKAAGGTAYSDMVAVLDQAVDAVEKSGVFGEIGKSGGTGDGNAAEAKITGIAKGYMEKDPSLSYNAAMAKAWENNPDLMAEYEQEAGF